MLVKHPVMLGLLDHISEFGSIWLNKTHLRDGTYSDTLLFYEVVYPESNKKSLGMQPLPSSGTSGAGPFPKLPFPQSNGAGTCSTGLHCPLGRDPAPATLLGSLTSPLHCREQQL